MQNEYIELIPADASLAEQLAEYYRRNREFLEAFEPARSEVFFLQHIKGKSWKRK